MMTPKNSGTPPGTPAKSADELAGLVFDVPCMKCGKNVFTVPYVANAHHVLTCQACKGETWVLIDAAGGIKYFEKEVALQKIQAALYRKTAPPATGSNYYYAFESYEVKISKIEVVWRDTTKDGSQTYSAISTFINWTLQ
jgi:hypothetical protein